MGDRWGGLVPAPPIVGQGVVTVGFSVGSARAAAASSGVMT
jgi:hypothetical protein